MTNSLSYSPRLNWEDARAVCLGLEGDLVSIENSKEMEFIKNIYSKLRLFVLWIGLNGRLKEDQFVWSDGTPLNSSRSYSNWNDGEPNNRAGNEDCVELRDNGWNDQSCSDTVYYICERPKGGSRGCCFIFIVCNPNYIRPDKVPLRNL